MKTNLGRTLAIIFSIALVGLFSSCKKEISATNSTTGSSNPAVSGVTANATVPVGISSATNDSIYVVGACDSTDHLDTMAFSNLPAAITTFLDSSYAGYSFMKAFTQVDSSGNITGYVVIINFNNLPVGLKFDASGNFIKVLEQRGRQDLGEGPGYHEGGCFSNRDGRNRDTVAITGLPASITNYFATNYPQDTLVRAYRTLDSSYVILSIDNGSFATLFDSTGTFVKRIQLNGNMEGRTRAVVAQNALPASVQTYLTSTYPNYVFEQAFSISQNNAVVAYVVCIDANGTKYGVLFDASGNFIRAVAF